MFSKVLTSFCLFLSLFSFSCKEQNQSVVEMLTAQEMVDMMSQNDFPLVDVRTPEEFQEGAIKNAINMDFLSDSFEAQINNLDPNEPLIIYCKSGGRSNSCAMFLEKAGFVKVYNLVGGISQWTNLGLPIVVPQD